MTPWANDEVGNDIKVGDLVRVTALDAGRGAYLYLTQCSLLVTSIAGRSRITVQAPSRRGTDTVGPELVKVIKAVDSRPLRTWSDVHAEQEALRVG